MSLAPGTRLGPYEITGSLGAGGMGEVHKAKDTRLERTVAIKVLPADVSATPERKQRFAQEAKAASALNHPHIITIHDIAADGGIDFIVMEYVPGQTLDQVIPCKGMQQNAAGDPSMSPKSDRLVFTLSTIDPDIWRLRLGGSPDLLIQSRLFYGEAGSARLYRTLQSELSDRGAECAPFRVTGRTARPD